jgi:hypothetical protein
MRGVCSTHFFTSEEKVGISTGLDAGRTPAPVSMWWKREEIQSREARGAMLLKKGNSNTFSVNGMTNELRLQYIRMTGE